MDLRHDMSSLDAGAYPPTVAYSLASASDNANSGFIKNVAAKIVDKGACILLRDHLGNVRPEAIQAIRLRT